MYDLMRSSICHVCVPTCIWCDRVCVHVLHAASCHVMSCVRDPCFCCLAPEIRSVARRQTTTLGRQRHRHRHRQHTDTSVRIDTWQRTHTRALKCTIIIYALQHTRNRASHTYAAHMHTHRTTSFLCFFVCSIGAFFGLSSIMDKLQRESRVFCEPDDAKLEN